MSEPQRITYPPVLDLVRSLDGTYVLPPVQFWTSGGRGVSPSWSADGSWIVYGFGPASFKRGAAWMLETAKREAWVTEEIGVPREIDWTDAEKALEARGK